MYTSKVPSADCRIGFAKSWETLFTCWLLLWLPVYLYIPWHDIISIPIVCLKVLVEVLRADKVELDFGAERAVAVVGLGVCEDSSDGLLCGVASEVADPPGKIIACSDVDFHGAWESAAASTRAPLLLECRIA